MLFFKAFTGRGQPLHAPFSAPRFPRPVNGAEAEWTTLQHTLKICSRGWHLAPANWSGINSWVQPRREIWLAEIAEGCTSLVDYHSDKFVVSEARLYRQLTGGEVGKVLAANQAATPYYDAALSEAAIWQDAILKPIGVTLKPGERQRLIDGANWFAGQRAKGKGSVDGYKTHREVVLSVNL